MVYALTVVVCSSSGVFPLITVANGVRRALAIVFQVSSARLPLRIRAVGVRGADAISRRRWNDVFVLTSRTCRYELAAVLANAVLELLQAVAIIARRRAC